MGSAVCKPSSVLMTIYLRASSPMRSSDTAEADGQPCVPPHLAPDGVYMTDESPGRRCALTAPFHPYLNEEAVYLCCTFPEVAFGGRYPLSLPCGARTFLIGRLSPLPPRLSVLLARIFYRK